MNIREQIANSYNNHVFFYWVSLNLLFIPTDLIKALVSLLIQIVFVGLGYVLQVFVLSRLNNKLWHWASYAVLMLFSYIIGSALLHLHYTQTMLFTLMWLVVMCDVQSQHSMVEHSFVYAVIFILLIMLVLLLSGVMGTGQWLIWGNSIVIHNIETLKIHYWDTIAGRFALAGMIFAGLQLGVGVKPEGQE
jgi:hypothetical protein